jgi:hypothetical protein
MKILKILRLGGIGVFTFLAFADDQPKIRVFVSDSETWRASSFNAGAVSSQTASAFGMSQAGQSKFTTAVMAQVYKECPSLLVVSKEDTADYFIRVEQDLTVWSQHQNLAVFDKKGEMVFAASSGLISRDVKRMCETQPFGAPKKKKKH